MAAGRRLALHTRPSGNPPARGGGPPTLRASPPRAGDGGVGEGQLDKGRGPVATVLVKRGTLKRGDIVVAGSQWGKVRALTNERGQQLKTAGPTVPAEVLGLDGAPDPGDPFVVVDSEAGAREIPD